MLLYDKWILVAMFVIPLIFALMIGTTFKEQVIHDLPVAVVDMDDSSLSRNLVRQIDASKTIKVTTKFLSMRQAVTAMRASEVYAVVEIPYEFSKKVTRGESPQVSAFYNSQFVMIGRAINSALAQVVGTANVAVSALRKLSSGNVRPEQAYGHSIALQRQGIALYNMSASYGQYLVPAILPCAWQIIILAITVLSLGAVDKAIGLDCWIRDYGMRGVFFKLTFYQIVLLGMGLGFLSYFYLLKNWHMNGSVLIVMFTQYLTVLASQAIGWFIYLRTRDTARALSLAAVYSASSMAFVGVTFPASDMEFFARFWRSLLPITHYMRVQIMQASYDAPFDMVLSHWWPLMLMAAVVFLGVQRQVSRLRCNKPQETVL